LSARADRSYGLVVSHVKPPKIRPCGGSNQTCPAHASNIGRVGHDFKTEWKNR
jgi:hypothetical protein